MKNNFGHKPWFFLRVAGLSASTLLFQITLTRLFSVAQFYHFVFLIISMAMLGYAVSGVWLTFLTKLEPHQAKPLFGWLALCCSFSFLIAYLILNYLPFDSFTIAWDFQQILLFGIDYIALTIPFALGGLAIGILLFAYPNQSNLFYAMNFIGSGLGCLIGLGLPGLVGGEGTVVSCCVLAGLSSFPLERFPGRRKWIQIINPHIPSVILLVFIIICIVELGFRYQGDSFLQLLNLRLSPYKGLSYALQYPDAHLKFQRWNAFSRVDVVQSANIRSLPGLSVQYQQSPPQQDGLFVDGDDLSPIIHNVSDLSFSAYLPETVAFQLRPNSNTLILEPKGGLDILVAIEQGSNQIVAVENNPLIITAATSIYHHPAVQIVNADQRSYLQKSSDQFDVIVLSLTTSFHPVLSGAYSLAEDYRYTLESYQTILSHLKPDGILFYNRWLQKPPSECLRSFALAVTALEQMGLSPSERLVTLRSYSMATILVKLQPFTTQELSIIHDYALSHSLDYIYAPNLNPADTNRFNILETPIYAQTFQTMLDPNQRETFYHSYPYDVSPPTDDHPFFAHTFKWAQSSQILSELGKTWQPFGGAGMLVVLGLFLFVLGLGAGLVGLVYWRSRAKSSEYPIEKPDLGMSFYFSAIGFGYMLVELPLIQRFQLYLEHPAYSMSAILLTLLIFSGLGSIWSKRIRVDISLILVCGWWLLVPFGLKILFQTTLALPILLRGLCMAAIVAPGGFLMGCAFPGGLSFWFKTSTNQNSLPLIWALNGAASVVASVAAMLLALSWGFNLVLSLGALCYGIAFLTVRWKGKSFEHRLSRIQR